MTTLARSFRQTDSSRPQTLPIIAGRPLNVGNMAETKLQLQYRVRPGATPVFSYREWSHTPAPVANVLERGLHALASADMGVRYRFFGSLDIAVSVHDTVIEVETFNSDLSWSLEKDAVEVQGGHPNLYDLLYWDGDAWVKRDVFTKPSCRLIRLTAKHNKAGKLGDRYKFTYNVVFTPLSGGSSEHPIDPDIKNPSV